MASYGNKFGRCIAPTLARAGVQGGSQAASKVAARTSAAWLSGGWSGPLLAVVLAATTTSSAHAYWADYLSPRDLDGDGVVDAWYDSRTQSTWLADWKSRDPVTWQEARDWAEGLSFGTATNWRLPGNPTVTPDPQCSSVIGNFTYGWGCRSSQMGDLWHTTLGNPTGRLLYPGPFDPFEDAYWSSPSQYDYLGQQAPANTDLEWAYFFSTRDGFTGVDRQTQKMRAVAVHAGDVGTPLNVTPPPPPPPPPARERTQTFFGSFSGSGGDLTYGSGDVSTKTFVTLALPLFDGDLGQLDRVDLVIRAYRAAEFSCTQGLGGILGSCSLAVDANFVMRADNYTEYKFQELAQVRATSGRVWLSPERGESESETLFGTGAAFVSIDDDVILERHFSDADGGRKFLVMYVQVLDGGALGQGGSAGVTALDWFGDAQIQLIYHYTAPVPEPHAYALMLGGLVLVGYAARRGRRA